MSLLFPSKGKADRSLTEKILILVAIVIGGYFLLPYLTDMAMTILREAEQAALDLLNSIISTAEGLARTVALAAFFVGALFWMSPIFKHHKHARHMVLSSLLSTFLVAIGVTLIGWISSVALGLTTDGLSIAVILLHGIENLGSQLAGS